MFFVVLRRGCLLSLVRGNAGLVRDGYGWDTIPLKRGLGRVRRRASGGRTGYFALVNEVVEAVLA